MYDMFQEGAIDMGSIRVMVPQLMAENDLTISQLAKLLDVSWPTAQKIVKGQVTQDYLKHLAILCEIFSAKTGDILVFQPDGGGR